MPHLKEPTAADLRAEIARIGVPIYQIAPHVGQHPARLGQVLRGNLPLTPKLARRIERAIELVGKGR